MAVSSALAVTSLPSFANAGKASVYMRLRHESVDQDNTLENAEALTLRTRLGYKTASYNGFSGTIEFEDSRSVLGINDYNDANGMNAGVYSVIADPETTELDQGFIQFKSPDLPVKAGRQLIAWDNQRFVGHVGWRQDRQTFDGLTLSYQPSKALSLNYGYISQRNRLFAEDGDLDAKDHLFNVSYKTSFGTLAGYGYLLEIDEGFDNSLDTFGFSFNGSQKPNDMTLIYGFEYAN